MRLNLVKSKNIIQKSAEIIGLHSLNYFNVDTLVYLQLSLRNSMISTPEALHPLEDLPRSSSEVSTLLKSNTTGLFCLLQKMQMES